MSGKPGERDFGRAPLVLTWCSARKRSIGDIITISAPRRHQSEVEKSWQLALRSVSPQAPAADSYVGRGFLFAKAAAAEFGADLSVISAGLGWVRGSTLIPAYDATLNGNIETVCASFDALHWWRSVISGRFSTDPHEDLKDRPLVLASISQSYAPFFVDALRHVPIEKLRVFGSGLFGKLPEEMREAIMPYDARLNFLHPGTRADYAQRAMAHFLSHYKASSLERDKANVMRSMSELPDIENSIARRRVDDDEMRTLILESVALLGARPAILLRHLRDNLQVACEQGRLSRLVSEITSK